MVRANFPSLDCLTCFGFSGVAVSFCAELPSSGSIYTTRPDMNPNWIGNCGCKDCLNAILKDPRAKIVHELVSARLTTLQFEKDFVVLLEEEKKD